MATLTKEYMAALKEAKLIEKQDVPNIVSLTKQRGFRDGKGYSNQQIRNVFDQYTTTDDLVALIMNYFSAKKEMREKLQQDQNHLLKN
jgi:hypothetical protein